MDRQRQKWVVRSHTLTHPKQAGPAPAPKPAPHIPSSGEWEDLVTAANAVVEAVRRGGMPESETD